jgi:RNA polymerase sigma-54 factor
MRLGAGQSQQQRQQQQGKVDPKIILTSHVLQLSSYELETLIESELIENPALEWIEDQSDPITDEEILSQVAPAELKTSEYSYDTQKSTPADAGTAPDWVDLTADTESLPDFLTGQLRVALAKKDWHVIDYLVGSLDDNGYLKTSVEEVALHCEITLEEAEAAIKLLQSCEPPGVGAADLQECLSLQLRNPKTEAERLARVLLVKYWDELVTRSLSAIQKKSQAPEELIEEALAVILELQPFPVESLNTGHDHLEVKSNPARPDLKIRHTETGWEIESFGPSSHNLRVASAYTTRLAKLKTQTGDTADEKRHILEQIASAERFLEALGNRQSHLKRIGEHLIESQAGFLKTGDYLFLKPLTRSQLAKDIDLHESTVSRATAEKYLQIATGEVVPFEVLFKPALRIQKMIEEILLHENPNSPLSDEQISKILAEKGVRVARRTVNKYRDRNRLLSSRYRRTA